MPQGELTEAQLEVMEAVWSADRAGASVAEIWDAINQQRPLARTTVLTMVARLEERGWLKRVAGDRALRYRATRPRQQAVAKLATQFVRSFFKGSPSAFLKCLLGGEKVSAAELRQLKELIRAREQNDEGSTQGPREKLPCPRR